MPGRWESAAVSEEFFSVCRIQFSVENIGCRLSTSGAHTIQFSSSSVLPWYHFPLVSMASLDNCFVEKVIEPVQVIDVRQHAPTTPPSQQPGHNVMHARCSTLEELTAHFDNTPLNDYSCRLMLVHPHLPTADEALFLHC
jgi:hypothetical protein